MNVSQGINPSWKGQVEKGEPLQDIENSLSHRRKFRVQESRKERPSDLLNRGVTRMGKEKYF